VPRQATRRTQADADAAAALADTDYRELQARAKEAGIAGNQSAEALREQLAAATEKPAE
jgi:hypothetical protein